MLLTQDALAVDPDERLDDPALEARAQELGAQLRCVVCKSQSIEASDAPLASDLRILVRERIAAGDSDEVILEFMAERYGRYVLLKPPVQGNTAVLWIAPIALFVIGAMIGVAVLRSRNQQPTALDPLTAEEDAKLKALSLSHKENQDRHEISLEKELHHDAHPTKVSGG
ncbi:MAG: cytochrome c-type biogenesis protein [Pseudomonadota bacterium]